MYESEDPGEVDIEAFFDRSSLAVQGGQFVDGSAVEGRVRHLLHEAQHREPVPGHPRREARAQQLRHGFHQDVGGPTATTRSWHDQRANPWDASKDAANNTTDWNVSKDLLVRGRVSGWFTNSNPSGRARDDSDPHNVLPADRWVMPDDWVNIAGGNALAGSFRPSYDLMFAPNNTVGLALTSPTGTVAASVALTAAAGSAATTVINVNTTGAFGVGSLITIGTSTCVLQVTAINSGTQFVVTGAIPRALALSAGSGGWFAGLPYLGNSVRRPVQPRRHSWLLRPNTGPGAAISNNGGAQTRDTTQGDFVVDWWDAPMPPANISVAIRGTGFIHQVIKSDVYYLGTANTTGQIFPNPYYVSNVPESPVHLGECRQRWLPLEQLGQRRPEHS